MLVPMDTAVVKIINYKCENVISTERGLLSHLQDMYTQEVFEYMKVKCWTLVTALPTKNGGSEDFTYFYQRPFS